MRTVMIVALSAGIAVISLASFALAAETASKSAATATKAAPAKTKPATAAPATKTAPKTLEEITIEGEVRLPEVLFITSRDVERPLDWLDGYLNAETGAAARADEAPVHVHVVPASPSDSAAVGAQVGAEILFLPATESAP